MGKTCLVRTLKERLGGGTALKVGHGLRKDREEILFRDPESAARFIRERMAGGDEAPPYLFVEANRIHPLVEPDLSIFLGATSRPAKASARQAREHADIVLDGRLSVEEVASVAAQRLRRGARFSAEEADRLVEAIDAFYRSYLRRTDACALTAVILAGGRATRLGGRDKASLPVGGKTLLNRRVDLLQPLCPEIVIVSHRLARPAMGRQAAPEPSARPARANRDIRIVGDEAPGCGPLMGLYTGLLHSRTERSFITACDMPFLSRPLLLHLRSYADTCDAVVPRIGRYLEPLFAVYSHDCLHAVRAALDRGNRRADSFLDLVRTRYVDEPELRRYDPELISFFNVNTPEDLERAERLVSAQADRVPAGPPQAPAD